jgi:hypothetical protein
MIIGCHSDYECNACNIVYSADIFETLHQWARRAMKSITSGAANLKNMGTNAFYNFAKAWTASLHATMGTQSTKVKRKVAAAAAKHGKADPVSLALRTCLDVAIKVGSSVHAASTLRPARGSSSRQGLPFATAGSAPKRVILYVLSMPMHVLSMSMSMCDRALTDGAD